MQIVCIITSLIPILVQPCNHRGLFALLIHNELNNECIIIRVGWNPDSWTANVSSEAATANDHRINSFLSYPSLFSIWQDLACHFNLTQPISQNLSQLLQTSLGFIQPHITNNYSWSHQPHFQLLSNYSNSPSPTQPQPTSTNHTQFSQLHPTSKTFTKAQPHLPKLNQPSNSPRTT